MAVYSLGIQSPSENGNGTYINPMRFISVIGRPMTIDDEGFVFFFLPPPF